MAEKVNAITRKLNRRVTRAVHPQPAPTPLQPAPTPLQPEPEGVESDTFPTGATLSRLAGLDDHPVDFSLSQSTPSPQDTRPPSVSPPSTTAPPNDESTVDRPPQVDDVPHVDPIPLPLNTDTAPDAGQPEDEQQHDELYDGRVLKFLLPLVFGTSLTNLNSTIEEKDAAKRKAQWEGLEKRHDTRCSTLQVLSMALTAMGMTFKTVSFPADIDNKNTMSANGFTFCIVLSGLSTAVLAALRFSPFGEKTISVVDALPIAFTAWVVTYAAAFLLALAAVISFLVPVLISVWKGDGDTGFKIAVMTTTIAIASFFIVMFLWSSAYGGSSRRKQQRNGR